MSLSVVLASGSAIRAELLTRAGVPFEILKPRIDEEMVRRALEEDGEPPRNVADALAQLKAEKIARQLPGALVIGCDQVLELEGRIFSKPESAEEAAAQIRELSGKRHMLHSAAVICEGDRAVWRKVATVRMTMRNVSESYLNGYIARNWPEIGSSCGGYQVENEGVRLFSRIDGDYFSILGLPLLDILDYLAVRGAIDS